MIDKLLKAMLNKSVEISLFLYKITHLYRDKHLHIQTTYTSISAYTNMCLHKCIYKYALAHIMHVICQCNLTA